MIMTIKGKWMVECWTCIVCVVVWLSAIVLPYTNFRQLACKMQPSASVTMQLIWYWQRVNEALQLESPIDFLRVWEKFALLCLYTNLHHTMRIIYVSVISPLILWNFSIGSFRHFSLLISGKCLALIISLADLILTFSILLIKTCWYGFQMELAYFKYIFIVL